jgi:glycolate oxidase FAD binding subunit
MDWCRERTAHGRSCLTMTLAPAPTLPSTIDDVAGIVRDAYASRTAIRITGAGTWPAGGSPATASQTLRLSSLSGIVRYVPGDLTLTALAGTSLVEIAHAAVEHGQWLPLDPFGDPRGTLGATLATASSGPLGGSIGQPRDLTVGLTFVTGEGLVAQGGGRVVKNVAGFDLVRMNIGAWGTLGVIVEATVRLRARPAVDRTLALDLPDEPDALATRLRSFRQAAIEPLCAELLSPTCANRIGLGLRAIMLVRLAGNDVGVTDQVSVLSRLGSVEDVTGAAWSALQASDPAEAQVIRVSRRPSELARLWSVAMRIPVVDAHATVARGIVRLRLTSDATFDVAAFDAGDHWIEETRRAAAVASGADEAISRRLRQAFDPAGILNPGVMGAP